MVNKIFNLLNRIPGKGNVITALLIILLVWFVAPLIPVGGQHVFSSTSARLSILAILGGVWVIALIARKIQNNGISSFPQFFSMIIRCKNYVLRFFVWLFRGTKDFKRNTIARIKQQRRKNNLHKQPWYLVVGPNDSGKKTLLANAGLFFIKPDFIGAEAKQTIKQHPDYDWWFTENAVFVDVAVKDEEREGIAWKRFMKLLKRDRKHKPLNGIILTYSLADLLLDSNKDRQDFIQKLSKKIRELHHTFKSQVPVYLTFSKCDQIDGFMEYFSNLSQDELNSIWGITFPLEKSADYSHVIGLFDQQYQHLIIQLRQRVLWAMDADRQQHGRELIHCFPQQMQLFKKPISGFISELFGAVRYPNALQLRGVYFVSAKQDGSVHDFLFEVISRKFHLQKPTVQKPQRLGECYFLRRFFHDTVFPEAPLLGDSEKTQRKRRFFYKLALIATPVIIIGMVMGMNKAYHLNTQNLNSINLHLNNYNNEANNLEPGDDSIVKLIPLLSQLDTATDLYRHKSSWTLSLLYQSYSIHHHIRAALDRSLQVLFLPRVASQLESRLNSDVSDQTLLYALLKGYLAFDAYQYTKPIDIIPPMAYQWDKEYSAKHKELVHALRYYLKLAVSNQVDKLPLNKQLINRARAKLEAIDPADRAYGMLKLQGNVSDLPILLLNGEAGHNFNQVFDSNGRNVIIKPLFTMAGYRHILLSSYSGIATEVVEDNKDIGLVSINTKNNTVDQVSSAMFTMYNSDYTKRWDAALSHIQIRRVTSLPDAVRLLSATTDDQSPFSRLLDVIYDNTKGMEHASSTVEKHFTAINDFSRNHASYNQIALKKSLNSLRDYLNAVVHSPDSNEAAYKAVRATMLGQNTPVNQLAAKISTLPEPVQRWVKRIDAEAWKALTNQAHAYLNELWHVNVMKTYNELIRGRYPLNASTSNQISINDFNQFFGPKGKIESFFDNYLAMFINTNKDQWQTYVVNNHTIQLSDSVISLFQTAKNIRDDYFIGTQPVAALHYTLTPETLDSQLSAIMLNLGQSTLDYRHGPRNEVSLHWPLPTDNNTILLQMTDFDGMQFSQSYSGPWSLFKLLQSSHVQKMSNGNNLVELNLHHYSASFVLKADVPSSVFTLRFLKGYRLPQSLSHVVTQEEAHAY